MLTLLDPRAWTFRAVVTAWVLLVGVVSASMSVLTRWPWGPAVRAFVQWAGQPLWHLLDFALLWCVLLPLVYGGARLAVWHAARGARARGHTH